jgi:hypothetical protein
MAMATSLADGGVPRYGGARASVYPARLVVLALLGVGCGYTTAAVGSEAAAPPAMAPPAQSTELEPATLAPSAAVPAAVGSASRDQVTWDAPPSDVSADVGTSQSALPAGAAQRLVASAALDGMRLASDGDGGDAFGWSAALSGDGKVLVVGAWTHNARAGEAFVYTKGGAADWSDAAEVKLTPDRGRGGFGISVAISYDGGVIAIGAFATDAWRGAVYVYTRPATGEWGPGAAQVVLTAPDGATNDQLGTSVAISADASTIVATAYGWSSFRGAAYVYTKPATAGWTASAAPVMLTAPDGMPGDRFGTSSALSSDGSTVIIGAPQGNAGTGAVYVYTRPAAGAGSRSASEVTLLASEVTLLASDGSVGDDFGCRVAASADGRTVVVGARGFASDTGRVYIYSLHSASGRLATVAEAILMASNGAVGDWYGFGVAVSGNGATIAVGAHQRNSSVGAAYVYTLPAGGSWTSTPAEVMAIAGNGGPGDFFGYALALDAHGQTLAVGTMGYQWSRGAVYMAAVSALPVPTPRPPVRLRGQAGSAVTAA